MNYQPSSAKPPAFAMNLDNENNLQKYNWNNMPWKSNTLSENESSVVMFNGIPSPSTLPSTSGINLNKLPRIKRKSNQPDCNYFPSKQLITEEKMSLHLNGMHLSDSFQAHNINLSNKTFEEEDMDMSYNVNLSTQELERRLKNAQRITVCDDIKKSLQQQENEIIPKVLLDRIEKPCRALILWTPPQSPLQTLLKTNFNDNKIKIDDDNDIKNNDVEMCE